MMHVWRLAHSVKVSTPGVIPSSPCKGLKPFFRELQAAVGDAGMLS